MTFAGWIGHNWFAFVQTGSVSAGLFLTGIALLLDARARRVANLIQLTQQHRDLWERMYLGLQLHSGPLSTIRGATAPSRNGLSHVNHRTAGKNGRRTSC
jgi:hypothetical protein